MSAEHVRVTDTSDESTRDLRRKRVLKAAAERLGSVAFDWRKGLTFDLLVDDTGIDRSLISSDFGKKDQLIADLIDYCLDPDNFGDFGEPWAADLIEKSAERLFDPQVDLFDSLTEIGNLDFAYVNHDARLRSQLAIWGLALDDERARSALKKMYHFYDAQHREVWTEFLNDLARCGIHPREGLTTSELVTTLTSLVEGLAIRWHVDNENVPEDLFGRVFATLASALFATDDDPASVRNQLAELDEARRRS